MLLISNSRLGSSDAVSIQLNRLLAPSTEPIYHCYWNKLPPVQEEPAAYFGKYLPFENPYRPPVGRSLSATIWKSQIFPLALKYRLMGWVGETGAALVVVDNQTQAEKALHVLSYCQVDSYLVHLMDLLVDPEDPLSADSPLGRLIMGARAVRTVSERLGERIRHLCKSQVAILAANPEFYVDSTVADKNGEPAVLVSSGNFYNAKPEKIRFLNEIFFPAWREFKSEAANKVSWVHCGTRPLNGLLSDEIEAAIDFTGYIPDSRYAQLLKESRCALLPLEHFAEEGWRYSVPSRLVDYLAAGLPTILPPCEDTATADFAAAHRSFGFVCVSDKEACLDALRQSFGFSTADRSRGVVDPNVQQRHRPEVVRQAFIEAWSEVKNER